MGELKDQMGEYQVVSLNLFLYSKSVDFTNVLVLFFVIYPKNLVLLFLSHICKKPSIY